MKKEKISTQKLKIGIMVGVGIAVLLAIILSVVLLLPNVSNKKDSGAGEEINGYSAVFRNRYQITQLYGDSGSAEVLGQIEKVIFDEGELDTAPQENVSPDEFEKHYEVIILETSVKKYTEYPLVYTFRVVVSDGREYDVYVRRDIEHDSNLDERNLRMSTVIVRGDIKFFNTDAVNENLLEALNAWYDKF